jgi:hypothetical protein
MQLCLAKNQLKYGIAKTIHAQVIHVKLPVALLIVIAQVAVQIKIILLITEGFRLSKAFSILKNFHDTKIYIITVIYNLLFV